MDYANGKIYTIRSYQTDKYYIGSTTQPLSKRLSGHKTKFNQGNMDTKSVEIVKYEDAYIELLEDYPCSNKRQLNKREGQLIRQYKNECVNKNIAGRTIKEYEVDNKEKIAEDKRKYNELNKLKIAEQKKLNYENNKDSYLEYQKEYRVENKDKIAQKKKEYYELNKEAIKEKARLYRIKNNITI